MRITCVDFRLFLCPHSKSAGFSQFAVCVFHGAAKTGLKTNFLPPAFIIINKYTQSTNVQQNRYKTGEVMVTKG
jgi:hypothetical protein